MDGLEREERLVPRSSRMTPSRGPLASKGGMIGVADQSWEMGEGYLLFLWLSTIIAVEGVLC